MTDQTFTDPDAGKTPEQLFAERNQRVTDAMLLKQPDRVPVLVGIGYMLAELGGITRQELHANPQKAQEITEKAALELQPDIISGVWGGPEPSRALGDRMTKWPGYGLGPNGSFQFDEHDFMKAEDYDKFLKDPSDYAIRTYLPRAFSELEGLAALPPLGTFLFGYYSINNFAAFASPPLQEAIKAIGNAIDAIQASGAAAMDSMQRTAALGFAPATFLAGALVEAPFDFMSDTLRGMRGIFLDMMRIPDKLLAAEEKVLEFQLEFAINQAKVTGLPYAFIPLHRGSDGFMSLPQFEKFYWPQLKALITGLVDAGITPTVFYEGVWDQRLEYLAELPKGKTVGMFQASDIFKVKEVVGNTMCIMGGMPVPMLKAGTVEQVRELTKELCERVGKDGGFIMTTGVLELEGCKMELIKAWVEATKEFGVY